MQLAQALQREPVRPVCEIAVRDSSRWLQRLAEVPAMALGVIHRVAVRAVCPPRDLGHLGPRSLRALAVRHEIGDRDALQLGNLAKLSRPPEARPRRAQHEY